MTETAEAVRAVTEPVKKKTMVVLSGGMDSTVALALTIHNLGSEMVETVTFNYGSKHNAQENDSARRIAEYYGVPNTLVELPFVNKYFKSDLLQSGGEIPEGHYADPSMKRTVVPFRNGILLAIAAGFAESRECDGLVLGAHAGDHAIYPDCRPEFTGVMGLAMKLGTYRQLNLAAPFVMLTKTGIAKIGHELQVPFELTYSCYKGGEKHCGKCGTCFERIEAFRDSGVADPTIYE